MPKGSYVGTSYSEGIGEGVSLLYFPKVLFESFLKVGDRYSSMKMMTF